MRGQPSPLRGAVLGLLSEQPGYGFQLTDRLAQRLPAWLLGESSLYSILDSLAKDGLVASEETEMSGRPRQGRRVVYHLTEDGVAVLEGWIAAPPKVEAVRPDLMAKIAVAREEHCPAILSNLDDYERDIMALMRDHDQLRDTSTWHGVFLDLVSEQAELRLKAELDWVGYARDLLLQFRDRMERR